MIRSSLSDLCVLRAESLVPALSQVPNHHVYSVRSNSADSCRQVYVNGRPPATLTQRRDGGAGRQQVLSEPEAEVDKQPFRLLISCALFYLFFYRHLGNPSGFLKLLCLSLG